MEISNSLPGRRGVLRAFLVSIAVSALLGIGVLLVGEFSSFEVKVVLTSFSISVGTLGVLCGAALLEAKRSTFPSVPTMAVSCLATALSVLGMWGEGHWKLTAIVAIIAAAGAQSSLIGLANLDASQNRARIAAAGGGLLLAIIASGMIVGEADDEGIMRVLAALSVFTAAATLSVPVLHRMNAGEPAPASGGERVAMLCPACDEHQEAPLGDVRCPSCGAHFRVELVTGGAAPGAAVSP